MLFATLTKHTTPREFSGTVPATTGYRVQYVNFCRKKCQGRYAKWCRTNELCSRLLFVAKRFISLSIIVAMWAFLCKFCSLQWELSQTNDPLSPTETSAHERKRISRMEVLHLHVLSLTCAYFIETLSWDRDNTFGVRTSVHHTSSWNYHTLISGLGWPRP